MLQPQSSPNKPPYIHVLVVVDVVVVGAVVNHLRHEQIERGYGYTQAQEIEQGGEAVATEHI